MKKILFCLTILATLVSCREEEFNNVYSASTIHTIPYGGSGVLASGNYSGQGTATNVAGTTVTVDGSVTVDGMTISGRLNVPFGTVLIVNGPLHLGGGAKLDIDGHVYCSSFTQVSNTYLSNGKLAVTGKYTLGGGTTLYIENSHLEVGELVIVGNIQCVHNAVTEAANWYSMVEFTGAKYLNRGGGTNVCGPILLTDNNDQGASGVNMSDVTNAAIANNANVKTVYGVDANATLYQYDDNCSPLALMPSH